MPESVACNFCGAGSDRQKQLFITRKWDNPNFEWQFPMVRCCNCQLTFINPRPTPDELAVYYDENPECGCRAMYNAFQLSKNRRVPTEEIFAVWSGKHNAVITQRPNGKRILDVGCGCGLFIKRMELGGWEVNGVETSSVATKYISSVLGLHVHNGDLKSAQFPSGYFDVVTFWQVLEHINNPLEALKDSFRILAPGGLLIVELPNIATPAFWLFGKHYSMLQAPFHLYHFSPETLGRMCKSAGFITQDIMFSSSYDSFFFSGLLLFRALGYRLGVTNSRGKMVLDPGDLGKAIGMGEGVQGSSKGLRSSFISSAKKVVLPMFRLLGKLQQTFRIGDIITLYARKP